VEYADSWEYCMLLMNERPFQQTIVSNVQADSDSQLTWSALSILDIELNMSQVHRWVLIFYLL